MNLDELTKRISPEKTVLFLGSGAAVSSGGPTGTELAQYLCKTLANGEVLTDDLMEAASLLEMRAGREAIVRAVRGRLQRLQPAGSLVALAHFGWPVIFTSNYDALIEGAYRSAKIPIVVIRSNHDYSKLESSEGTPLFKIHGCVSQDIVDGSMSRMVLTERDYDDCEDYREILFKRLQLEIASRDVLILGHSLRDPHIKRDMAIAARLKKEKGARGNVFLILHESDTDRARLYEQKGISVIFASLEELVHLLAEKREQSAAPSAVTTVGEGNLLSARQLACVIDAAKARHADPDAKRMFHGCEASYADIRAGLTFKRDIEEQMVAALSKGSMRFVVITGVAGIGKTTLARRILSALCDQGFQCWEWRKEFPFRAVEWLKTDAHLREAKGRGVLFLDECTDTLRQVNTLADALSKRDSPALCVVLTANHAQWVPRIKSPELFRHGLIKCISHLEDSEIEGLVNLLDLQRDISSLVGTMFTTLPRKQKIERLRRKCSADMFVCLKHVFSFESLDTILLNEYSKLHDTLQDIYRSVACLEAAGGLIHRQLILRLIRISPTILSAFMRQLEGLVDEYDIRADMGLFGWRTRHLVIARTIARYKYADNAELHELLRSVIANINPTVWIELKLLRELCVSESGISRIANPIFRIQLYRLIIDLVPGERIPRHRLISTLLDMDSFDEAELEIRDAIERSKLDPPLQRYRVRLLLYKGLRGRGLQKEDRAALLREAERLAQEGISRFHSDKQAYRLYAEVGEAIAHELGDKSTLDHALHEMQEAMNRLLDPDFAELTRSFYSRRLA